MTLLIKGSLSPDFEVAYLRQLGLEVSRPGIRLVAALSWNMVVCLGRGTAIAARFHAWEQLFLLFLGALQFLPLDASRTSLYIDIPGRAGTNVLIGYPI